MFRQKNNRNNYSLILTKSFKFGSYNIQKDLNQQKHHILFKIRFIPSYRADVCDAIA